MKRSRAWLVCLALAGVCTGVRAQAPDAVQKLETLSAEEKGEFPAWLVHRGRSLDIPYPTINMINAGMADKSVKERIYALESFITADDFRVQKYLEMMEANARKYKRLNPYDRALLASMKMFGMARKQAWIDRFNKFADEQGIQVKPLEAKDAVGGAARGGPGRRYDPESGLFERYDEKKKEWVLIGVEQP